MRGSPPPKGSAVSSFVICLQHSSVPCKRLRVSTCTKRKSPDGQRRWHSAMMLFADAALRPTRYTRSPLPVLPWARASARRVYSPIPDVAPTKTATRGLDCARVILADSTALS